MPQPAEALASEVVDGSVFLPREGRSDAVRVVYLFGDNPDAEQLQTAIGVGRVGATYAGRRADGRVGEEPRVGIDVILYDDGAFDGFHEVAYQLAVFHDAHHVVAEGLDVQFYPTLACSQEEADALEGFGEG